MQGLFLRKDLSPMLTMAEITSNVHAKNKSKHFTMIIQLPDHIFVFKNHLFKQFYIPEYLIEEGALILAILCYCFLDKLISIVEGYNLILLPSGLKTLHYRIQKEKACDNCVHMLLIDRFVV